MPPNKNKKSYSSKLEEVFYRLRACNYLKNKDDIKILNEIKSFKRLINSIITESIEIKSKDDFLNPRILEAFNQEKDYETLVWDAKRLGKDHSISNLLFAIINELALQKYACDTYFQVVKKSNGLYEQLTHYAQNKFNDLTFGPKYLVSKSEHTFLVNVCFDDDIEQLKRTFFLIIQNSMGNIVGHRISIVDYSNITKEKNAKAHGEIAAQNEDLDTIHALEIVNMELLQHFSNEKSLKIFFSGYKNNNQTYFNYGKAYVETGYNPKWLDLLEKKLKIEDIQQWQQFYIQKFGFDPNSIKTFDPLTNRKQKLDSIEKVLITIDEIGGYEVDEIILAEETKKDSIRNRELSDWEDLLKTLKTL